MATAAEINSAGTLVNDWFRSQYSAGNDPTVAEVAAVIQQAGGLNAIPGMAEALAIHYSNTTESTITPADVVNAYNSNVTATPAPVTTPTVTPTPTPTPTPTVTPTPTPTVTPTPTPTVTPTPSAVIPTAAIPGVTPTPTPTPVIPTVTAPLTYDKTNVKQALNDAYVAKNTPLINKIISDNGLTQASVQSMYGLTPAQQTTMLNTAGVNWTPAQSASSTGTFTPNAGTPTANKGLLGVGGNVWDATYGLVSPYAKIMNQIGSAGGGLLANPYATAPSGSMGGFYVNKYDPLNEDIAAEIAKAKAAANPSFDSSVSPVAYMGGYIDKSRIAGPNPPGPDDGATNIQVGEYVIKKSAVKKYGKGLLDMINEGSIPAKKIKSLLG